MATEKEILIKEIAKDLYLREDVVRDVLNRYQDIAIETIVNTGEFKMSRFFSVSAKDFPSYRNSTGVIPAHQRLSVKLSEGVRKLFKLKNKGIIVNRDNWKTVLSTKELSLVAEIDETKEVFNPLLDGDDE